MSSERTPLELYSDHANEIINFPAEAQAFVDAHEAGIINEFRPDQVSPWRSPLVERQPGSEIDGLGLFAISDIPAGTLVAIKQGHIRTKRWVKLNRQLIRGTHQQVDIDGFLVGLTPDEVNKNLVGYNHSCEPNGRIIIPHGKKLAYLVTKENVPLGDEITTDYSASMTSNVHIVIECRCGKLSCRGTINPTRDWQNPVFSDEHRDDFPPYLQMMYGAYWSHWKEFHPWQEHIHKITAADTLMMVREDLDRIFSGQFGEVDPQRLEYIGRHLLESAGAVVYYCKEEDFKRYGMEPIDPKNVRAQLADVIGLASLIDLDFN